MSLVLHPAFRLCKFRVPDDFNEPLPDTVIAAFEGQRALAQSGFSELPVTAAHAAGVAGLPAIHRDPFDWKRGLLVRTACLLLLLFGAATSAPAEVIPVGNGTGGDVPAQKPLWF